MGGGGIVRKIFKPIKAAAAVANPITFASALASEKTAQSVEDNKVEKKQIEAEREANNQATDDANNKHRRKIAARKSFQESLDQTDGAITKTGAKSKNLFGN